LHPTIINFAKIHRSPVVFSNRAFFIEEVLVGRKAKKKFPVRRGPAYLKLGRSVRHRIEDILDFIEKNRIDPNVA